MKNPVLILITLITLVNVVNAKQVDDILRAQCQFLVYGEGIDKPSVYGLLLGIVDGQTYLTSKENITEYAKVSTHGKIVIQSCLEALNKYHIESFRSNFNLGVAATINKKYSEFKTVY